VTQKGSRAGGIRGTERYGTSGGSVSLRLDAGELGDLTPLPRFISNELSEIRRRARKHRAAEFGQLRLHLGIGEGRINLPVELIGDFGRRVLGHADAVP